MPRFRQSLVWFRRDLRTFDHAALYHALKESERVWCAFIFDKAILDSLPRQDRRVEFIRESVAELDCELRKLGGILITRQADAAQAIPQLARELDADAVFANEDYEPAAIARDASVASRLASENRLFFSFKDQVVFAKDEVLSLSGKPFSVFTPYKNAWLKKLQLDGGDFFLRAYPVDAYRERLASPVKDDAVPSLEALGFEKTNLAQLHIATGMSGGQDLVDEFRERMTRYHQTRDFPSVKGPSYLSVHLRFGTVSIRGLARMALDAMRHDSSSGAATWMSELVWRDFYFMILHHHPHVTERAFRPEYDAIRWESGTNAEEMFAAWREGRTGYPLVDAAMMQLNRTGYMHNRLRMVTASFLIKDLGIDWRRGERYFAEKLNDYDLAANNGGWQWAASSGCDAQPYFRIFNPVTQSEKFDPEGKFIKRYLPQLASLPAKHIHAPWLAPAPPADYPAPIVQHDEARKRTLARYAVVKQPAGE